MIEIGQRIPSGNFKELTDDGLKDVATDSLFQGRKVVMFGIPGAFTPTCSQKHLPGYVAKAAELAAKGVDEIVCMAVNDAFVMKAWADSQGSDGKVRLLADGNAELTRAMGLELDGSGAGLGIRCKRFSMVVEDGVVKTLHVENAPGDLTVSACEVVLGEV